MKRIFLLTTTAILTSIFVSCNDDDVTPLGPDTTIVGFGAVDVQKFATDVESANLSIPVTLISYADEQLPSSDIEITWEIVASADDLTIADFDEYGDSAQDNLDAAVASYAEEGVEFDLVGGTTGTVTLPAGQTYTNIPAVVVHGMALDPASPKNILLRLTSASNGASVGHQYRHILVTLQGVCISDLAGNYNLVVTRLNSPATYNLPGEVILELSDGHYQGNSIGPYNSRGLISSGAQITCGLIFDEVCGSISVWKDPDWADQGDTGIVAGQAQNLGPYYNPVYQTAAQASNSSVSDSGVITIEYNIWFSAGTNSYRAVYTPE